MRLFPARHVIVLACALVFASFGVSACKKKVDPVPVSTAVRSVGDKVDIKWNSSWWKGEILAVEGQKYKIHYTGWSSSWDESVTSDRLRDPTPGASVGTQTTTPSAEQSASAAPSAVASASAAAVGAFKVGDKVDINWKGMWWQGTVIGTPAGQFRVHYVGWGANWDENVPASRLRAPTGTAKKGSGPN